jgi:hypothetical protein
MPIIGSEGAASSQGFGQFARTAVANYIEEVFSTWLYTGNGSTQTITNGIDLAGKGGLVWGKMRNDGGNNFLQDTVRGTGQSLCTNNTDGNNSVTNTYINAFNSNGFTLGSNATVNGTTYTYASWTFRKQPKFFDVKTVTVTQSGSTFTPVNFPEMGNIGCAIAKRIDTTSDWFVAHRSLSIGDGLRLNTTAATASTFINIEPTTVNFSSTAPNGTYVVYAFAHNAGGFGLTGTDNVISCGGVTSDGSGNATVNLGYEPQWLLIKRTDTTGNWHLMDTMRGLGTASGFVDGALLRPNLSDAEAAPAGGFYINSTGFQIGNGMPPNASWIYIAIRRGPMKVPTTGTSVFAPLAVNNALNTVNTTGFPVDLQWYGNRDGNANNIATVDRLRGVSTNSTAQQNYLRTASTAAEVNSGGSSFTRNWSSTGFSTAPAQDGANAAYWNFRRAPGFFDEVCYTGTGSARTVAHNLAAVPELMIVKVRSAAGINWSCYHSALGNTQVISLNEDIQAYTSSQWNNTTPTSAVFSVGTQDNVNGSGRTYVAYLFATVAGVSKVGSYTGTGTAQTINCGFTTGSRFVMIKRTDEAASGNPWFVWDTARGMIPANDPYLLLNSTAAEVTGTDFVDTASTGFEITSTAPAAINASGGTFIFLAIA